MATVDSDWKDCGLDLTDYKIVKLEPGDQDSYLDFQTAYQNYKQRGFAKSPETLQREAEQSLLKKERKIMSMDLD